MTGATQAIHLAARPSVSAARYAASGVVALAALTAMVALLMFGERVQEREQQRRVDEHLQRDLAAIMQGRGEDIFIYEPELLAMIAAEPQAVANATTLVFSRTDFSDSRFANIAKLKLLENVAINSCKNADALLGHMQGMESVEKLWIEESPISDRGVAALAALPNLKHVRFEQPVSKKHTELLEHSLRSVNVRLPDAEFRAGR